MSRSRNSKRFGYVLAGLVVAAATAGAVGAAMGATGGSADPRFGGGGHTGDPVTYASVTQAPTAAPASLDGAAGQVVRGLGGTNVQGVQASTSPAGLVVTVALAKNNDDVPDVWVADLAVGALGERMRTNQAVISDEIASATAVGPGSSGAQVTSNLGLGAVSLDQLRTALVGASPDVEGVLIELDNSAGQPLLLAGVAYRTGEGGLWFAPGQDVRFGAVHGDRLVREVVFPVAPQPVLRELVAEFKASGPTYQRTVKATLRASYTNHYRVGLIKLLDVLEFRSNNTKHRPVLDALELIRRYANAGNLRYYPAGEHIPVHRGLSGDWDALVHTTDTRGRRRAVRMVYEICTFQALREQLRCKEIWVVGR